MRILDRLTTGQDGVSIGRNLDDIRRRLHRQVIDRLDVSAIGNLSRDQLRTRLRDIVERLVATENMNLSSVEREAIIIGVLDEITGLGPLETLLADPAISDILVNGPDTIFVERKGRLERVDTRFRDNAHLINTISRIVGKVGRRVDEGSPMVDARLEDGSRVNAIIAPLALDGAALSIRRFGDKALSYNDLITFGAMTPDMMNYLKAAVVSKCNVLISGGTGAGKTTLLNALSNFIPNTERIITLEDSAELKLQQNHVVRLESRPPNIEGKGAITIGDLMKNALRMRPDRIVVGEVRGGEALDMLVAMNTGHEGSMGTLHANTPKDALQRLMTMITMGGAKLPPEALYHLIGGSLHVIVQAARLPDGQRKITSITEVLGTDENDDIRSQEIFLYRQDGMDANGKIFGEHAYVRESGYLERFYRAGALQRPGA
ncbi:CpaF family protein [Myxococcota bacterium]|nr:CpaF family protein [Myxococcota bacterium]MBU1432938.1 CpaF family protein [Myxococcota bacterium]MBU1896240.1 CpaF family protein [Myxococcota bacterium]